MALSFDMPYAWIYATFLVAWTIASILGWLVLAFRWQHAPSRALGLAQGLTSLVGVAYGLHMLETDPALSAFWKDRFGAFFSIARPFLWVYFAMSFPRPRGFAKRPATLALFFAPMIALLSWFLVDPSWMTPDLLWLIVMVGYLMGSYMSIVFFHAFLREAPGPVRDSLFLMSVGWLPGTSLVGGYWAITRFGFDPLVYAAAVAGVLMVYAYVYLAWRFLRHERTTGTPFESWRRLLFFAFPLTALAATAVATWIFFRSGAVAGAAASELVDALWCTAGVALITYGIMKYQLLGIDLKLKWTIRQSTVAAVFVAVFFVVSEAAQQLLSSRIGPAAGLVAAGLLVFAIAPLERAAGRISDAAMPGVRPLRELGPGERASLYLEQARFAWSDGQLSVKDRKILDVARERLGLTREETAQLEDEAMGIELRRAGAANAASV